ncbi:hypothetical protein NEMIN01_0144 [Nematocida minor]|uniref:uncharacterized protein n=1 Tax=Nematocida minor TaxID=1912983 RepID=UPI00221E4E3A|nr:uncharacterized protein NEMIN01_0040 [Nematocida minor]XP_051332046.1 uncharacterized protein NEMIN01_0144 [Nematocida minor]KAI5188776.1 hypothetical protein NEMIN01_0040 [Nematocida minor]KAI5188880.1 hypothetical protein NEMIN01_0144 [Nematocida minor]
MNISSYIFSILLSFMLYELFFTALIGVSWGSFFLLNGLTHHGRSSHLLPNVPGRLNKDLFILFYLNGILFFGALWYFKAVSTSTILLGAHICRRLIESAVYTYNSRSSMNILHLATGIVYYPVLLVRSLGSKSANIPVFAVASFVQGALHYCLFKKRKSVRYLHYLCELIIHCSINMDYLNAAWIISFSAINMLNRNK